MGYQDDYMVNNIKDTARLITKLLFGEAKMPDYRATGTDPERERLFETVMDLADQGSINEAENMLLTEAGDTRDDLELMLTFYLHLNDMDTDFLDNHDYSREEVLDGLRNVAEDWGVSGI
ncbi:MAG: hypothetical protein IJX90_06395 [Blautia sp.]|nr:hypothetical protein [Blautia sp.]